MTFYVDTKGTGLKPLETILRTQTSAMQGRVMKLGKPPFRVLVPGRNFRYEQVDASHGFEFWQVEGFVVDKQVHLTDLFGTIEFAVLQLVIEVADLTVIYPPGGLDSTLNTGVPFVAVVPLPKKYI